MQVSYLVRYTHAETNTVIPCSFLNESIPSDLDVFCSNRAIVKQILFVLFVDQYFVSILSQGTLTRQFISCWGL